MTELTTEGKYKDDKKITPISIPLPFKILFSCIIFLIIGCSKLERQDSKTAFWKQYDAYSNTQRIIDPKGYIDYLKASRFTKGELDNLPINAIILHDQRVEKYLDSLGITNKEYVRLETGETDPNVIYVVRSKDQKFEFIISPGLPGAGGITTQCAELGALGVKKIVHIGTCGYLGNLIANDVAVVSSGAYKDGAAVLLSDTTSVGQSEIAYPDSLFSSVLWAKLKFRKISSSNNLGFTIPIFYMQPSGLIKKLLQANDLSESLNPVYIEMEGAAFFQMAALMNMKASSIVVGTDRYILENGNIKHEFMDYDSDKLKLAVIRTVIDVFKSK